MAHVIITGGSSGIGLEIARIHLERGDNVSLVARRPEMLQQALDGLTDTARRNGAGIRIEAGDVTDIESASSAIARCESASGPCTTLVTSAGIVEPQPFDTMAAGVFDTQIATNFLGTVHAVRAIYGGMVERRQGRIMMISSAAALIGIHGYTAYCASKSALRGFAEALRTEAAAHNVSVSICYPPDTLTPQYQGEIEKRSHQAVALMGSLKPWQAQEVARRIVAATERGSAELHFGFSLTALAYLGPFIKPGLFWWADRKSRRRGKEP